MITAVILAAGEARRMGEAKQLLDWQGVPLIRHVVQRVVGSRFQQVRLVLGAYYDEILPQVDDLGIEVVFNPDYPLGQSSSVKRGLAGLEKTVQGVAFVLADQPLVQVETYNQLIDRFVQEKSGILLPTYQGQPGNPKFFHRRFFSELAQVEGDRGGRMLIRQYPDQVERLEVADPGILMDIDQKEDYRRLIAEVS